MNDSDIRSREIDSLASLVADLQEDAVLTVTRQRLAEGDDPLEILEQCQRGLRLVGRRFEQGRYYIAGLIMAGEILRQVVAMARPGLTTKRRESTMGKILLGTVQGDIHDLGKDITKLLLSSHGFEVVDLGVDVPSPRFVEEALNVQPDIVGLSGLLTAAFGSMKDTVQALRKATQSSNSSLPIIIGGRVDEDVRSYVGADYWCDEAMRGVRLCQQLVEDCESPGS